MRTGSLLSLALIVAPVRAAAWSPRVTLVPPPPAVVRQAPRPVQASAGGPRIDLGDLADPAALERALREAVEQSPPRVSAPGAAVYLGNYGVGTWDSLPGHLLVLNGSANVFGYVAGNVVALDGDVVIHPGAAVGGDALALGGEVRDLSGAVAGEVRTLGPSRRLESGGAAGFLERIAGLAGVTLSLLAIGFGLVTFARPSLEIVSDTVTNTLGRSFLVGLLAEILVVPTFGMIVIGLALTVVGALLIPFAVVAYLLLVLAALLLGIFAVAHALGETHTRRRMALGIPLSPNSYRYMLIGLAGTLVVWLVWALFGWVPVAGSLVLLSAILVTWLLMTIGLGASLLSRFGVRHEFAGKIVPPEALTDEYLWATPQMGVPAAKRPIPQDRHPGREEN